MNKKGLFKRGCDIRKWFVLGSAGATLLGMGLPGVLVGFGIGRENAGIATAFIITGAAILYIAYKGLSDSLILLGTADVSGIKRQEKNRRAFQKRLLMKGPRVVVIGGGTGLSVLLRGLKNYTHNITAVVNVSDDGGGSGVLRADLGMLPPGDIRNCILALADTEPIMEQLLQYRFKKGRLSGQCFGNLFIAAMNDISTSFEEAVKRMSQVLAVTGRVLPVTLEDTTLYAQLKNGAVVKGESNIPATALKYDSPIERVFLKPQNPEPLSEVLEAIDNADMIVLGPGSLYTSIIPNLLAEGLADRLYRSGAPKIYICNIMTQPGETDGFTVADHIRVLEEHARGNLLDTVIINSGTVSDAYLEKYARDGAEPVKIGIGEIRPGIRAVSKNLISTPKGYIRHDSASLARLIIKLFSGNRFRLMRTYSYRGKRRL